MCRVRGLTFGTRAISRAAELSSNIWQWTVGVAVTVIPFSLSSSRRYMTDLRYRVAVDNAIYSDSAELRAKLVCSLEAQ